MIVYEDDISLFSSFRQYHLSSSRNKQNKKNNEIHYLIWIIDDADQFDRPNEKKI